MNTIHTRPIAKPACAMAHGMASTEVPIMVFHRDRLSSTKQRKHKCVVSARVGIKSEGMVGAG